MNDPRRASPRTPKRVPNEQQLDASLAAAKAAAAMTLGAPEAFYQATLDALPAQVAVLDGDATILAVNAAWAEFGAANGSGRHASVGANYLDVCARAAEQDPQCEGAEVAAGLRELLAGGRDDLVVEYDCDTPTEHRRFVLRAKRFRGGGETRVVVQHQDVTALRQAGEAVRFRSQLLDAVDAAVVALDVDGAVIAWNRGAEELYGWSESEALGRPITALIATESGARFFGSVETRLEADGRWEGEQELQRKDGTRFPAYIRSSRLERSDGRPLGVVGVSVDHSGQLQAELDLRSARDYMRAVAEGIGDGLCTLDRFGRIVYVNPRAGELLGWPPAELPGKDLHATLHYRRPDGSSLAADDCPLVRARHAGVGARISDDVLVRQDGILLPVELLQSPFETEDGIGGFILLFSDITERKRRQRDADGRLDDLTWIERIRDAMENDRLVLYAQPIIEVASRRTVQHELLIRMLDDKDAPLSPALFLPVAERYGLISEIDRWVVRQGMGLAAEGHAVELNVSAHSFGDPTFYDYVHAELQRSAADPALLIFELTETALMQDEQAARQFVSAMSGHGCGLALDDFGTGYGGFVYLKHLPVDYLKIDIEFIRDLASTPASRKVVDAVVSLAGNFGLKTVAEGVEEERTLDLLLECGVDYAQGYAIGRPGPLKDVIRR